MEQPPPLDRLLLPPAAQMLHQARLLPAAVCWLWQQQAQVLQARVARHAGQLLLQRPPCCKLQQRLRPLLCLLRPAPRSCLQL